MYVSDVSTVETVEQGRSMAARTPQTILVVDDEPSIVRGLTRLLRHEGYAVTAASNGCEALAQLHQRPYDVILTDLRMPELDGCAFMRVCGSAGPLVPAGDLSYRGGDDADSQAFLVQSGRPWLAEPYAIAALRSLIQQTLGTAASV